MFYLKVILAACVGLLVWTGIVVAGVLLGWWRSPIAPEDDPGAFFEAAVAAAHEQNRGNVALVLLEEGRIYREHFASMAGDRLDRDTMFPTASLSKWITAWGVMKLVEEGRLDLDRPVSTYLTRWQLPRGAFDNDGVTARRLLSHTSGLTDGLGFGDYQPHEVIPPLEESLSRPRASDGRTVPIAVGREPGSEFDYSGGGYLLLQLIVEEVSGQRFEDYMRSEVLEPLGLTRSTFEYIGGGSNVSPSYDAQGQRAPLYRYAASGATGYSTSAADLATFVMAQLPAGLAGRPLSQASIGPMREPHAFLYGAAIWGLGTMLFAPTPSGDFVFGHDGANEPAINAAARVNPDTGDGIVVLASGNPTLASNLGFEWVFWQTGKPDFLGVGTELERSLPLLAAGGLLVVALAFIGAWRLRRRATRGVEPAAPDGAH